MTNWLVNSLHATVVLLQSLGYRNRDIVQTVMSLSRNLEAGPYDVEMLRDSAELIADTLGVE